MAGWIVLRWLGHPMQFVILLGLLTVRGSGGRFLIGNSLFTISIWCFGRLQSCVFICKGGSSISKGESIGETSVSEGES